MNMDASEPPRHSKDSLSKGPTGRRNVTSMASFYKPSRFSLSRWDSEGHRRAPEIQQEPTYRMHPEPKEMFRSDIATRIMTDLLNSVVAENEYDVRCAATKTRNTADLIKQRMKEQTFSKRYKYVCVVTIGERRSADPFGVSVCSRCLWDTKTDNFASASVKNKHLFAVATLYALYLE